MMLPYRYSKERIRKSQGDLQKRFLKKCENSCFSIWKCYDKEYCMTIKGSMKECGIETACMVI